MFFFSAFFLIAALFFYFGAIFGAESDLGDCGFSGHRRYFHAWIDC